MKRTEKWKKFVESSLSAAVFAEANAPELAREFLEEGERQELVLFATQADSISAKAIQRAVDLCHRLNCGLAVLLVGHFRSPAEIKHSSEELHEYIDVPAKIQGVCGSLPEAVQEFMDQHRRVISVVLEDNQTEKPAGKRSRKRRQQQWWESLSCPVVFIPTAQEA